jgi:hypothetical protein
MSPAIKLWTNITQTNTTKDTEKGPTLSERLETTKRELDYKEVELQKKELETQYMKTQVDNLKVEYSATKDQLKNQTETFKTRNKRRYPH